jgi:hypothetical protein
VTGVERSIPGWDPRKARPGSERILVVFFVFFVFFVALVPFVAFDLFVNFVADLQGWSVFRIN